MSKTNLVRASRDGDQFHYLWAARRCLLLISPTANLRAITVEGPSLSEADLAKRITTGEELIDVGEYYESESLEQATLIRYIQLKHSTVRTDNTWMPSELENTLKGFAARYVALQQQLATVNLNDKLEFWFVSNRPINSDFLEAILDVAAGTPTRHVNDLKKLEQFTSLTGTALANFCKLLRLEGNQEGLWDQQNILAQDVSYYLVDADVDAPIQLKELVTKKALSASADNPAITRMDVLRAFKTDESRLFPAPCLIKDIEKAVPREQELEILEAIVHANNAPIIVHAAGGVGKSVFATRIKLGLPTGSSSVLYDCFGNGQYRSASGYRHRHKDALIQIANELAAKGLCHPLIPSPYAEPSAYVRAFIYRLRQSITSLRSKNPQALLCIIIDAADNAQMAAEEMGEARAFVRDIIREQLPEGVRLIALCRKHRQEYLDPPPNTLRLELRPFSRNETAVYLRQVFIDATEQDIDEFHRLSSQNPRVQALALSWKISLSDTLRALGPNPTTVEDTIGNFVARLRDSVGAVEKAQIDRICSGLAALRPLIPLSVLASLSGVNEAAIKSFAFDLGRPLLVAGDTIQFFDEPSETWFRDRFKPTARNLADFVANLKPLAAGSSYIAAALPQLMLEAGQFDELVSLALSSQALPSNSPIEKRDIELQRLQFALKASLRAKRYTDAAKLAMKAGGESAGDERQRKLLQANTDLAAIFMDSNRIEELVSRRTFGSGWVGSHHAYEAGLLSGQKELLGDARSRLRMAKEWLRNWSQLSEKERQKEELSDNDILEMATAVFNIHGAEYCAEELRSWRPREVSFRIGRTLASRFIDHGRYQDLNELALAAGNDLYLVLAITLELREVHRTPPKNVLERTLRLAMSPHTKFNVSGGWAHEGDTILAVTALVEAAYKLSVDTSATLIALLTCYLPVSPSRGLGSRYGRLRFPLLRAYTLRAALSGQALNLIDLAHDELRKEFEEAKSYSESRDAREFKEDIGVLLPWHQLWASIFVNRSSSVGLANAITETKATSAKAGRNSYQEESSTADEVARVWFDILLTAGNVEVTSFQGFDQWIASLNWPLLTTTLTELARVAARSPSLEERSLDYLGKAFDLIRDAREDAASKGDSYVKLARAVLMVSISEAAAYFNQAVEIASKIGDENLDRWGALLDLADRAAYRDRSNPVTAYRLARCAELIYDYVDRDKHFAWEATVEAITGLCGKSSLAILTRWRDRNFGRTERILPITVNFLLARGDLDPKIALALICFRADWVEPLILKRVLASSNKVEREATIEFTYRYMTLEQQSIGKWRELKSILAEYDMMPSELDEQIAFSEREEQSSKSRESSYSIEHNTDRESKDKRDWNAVFEGLNLSVANDIAQAYQRYKDFEPPYYHEHFFDEACCHVAVGKEAEFIAAFANVIDFELYHLRILLEHIPERWRKRLAVKLALVQTLKIFCRRFCMAITRSRYYDRLPLKTACELSGLSESDLIDVVLTAIGEATEIAGTGRLFTLVGLLASKLTESEALEALSFGLDLLEPVLEDKDGDGPWSSKLEPPAEIEGSVAGYIWGCLAAPQASLRWEAAHVVRALCKLGNTKVLDHLISLASGASANVFSDTRLHFYELHARQWLLIGLARAAKDHPNLVAPYADFLIKLAFAEEPHVLIRELAKRTLLDLLDTGFLRAQTDLPQRLSLLNRSPFPTVKSEPYSRIRNKETDAKENDEADRFYFGLDIGPYWLEPLGRCFAKSQAAIEFEALQVIRRDWQISGGNRWDEDERHRRKIFRDRETYHSHGSYPREDELRFYLSYHAMMVTAGKLLATTPVHHSPDDSEDSFHIWLNRHDLSRNDGGWLADRRDPIPLERPKWKDEKETDEWRWSIARNDFDRVFITPEGRMNLWGRWKWVSGHREESIHVGSALVSPDRSLALLRALQSADNPDDYRIPDADDELQIDFDNFQLKGWITDQHPDSGLDEYDPWAGAIRYPTPRPAAYIIDLMKLTCDAEQRRWYIQDDNIEVAWAQVWGYFHEKADDEANLEDGIRFQTSFTFILSLLRELKMDLIVEVEIERRRRYAQWERSNDDDIGFIPPNARLFLIRADSNILTL